MSPPVLPAAPAQPPPTPAIAPEQLAVIRSVVQEALTPVRELFEKAQAATPPVPVGGQAGENRSPITGREVADGSGLTFIRLHLIRAKHMLDKGLTGFQGAEPTKEYAAAAKALGYGRVEKIFQESTLTSGGSFVQDRLMVEEWIGLLRNVTVARRSGMRQLSMPGGGKITMPRQTGSATATWRGEAEAVSLSEPTTDQVSWSAKALMVLVGISNSLIRNVGNASSEEFVRDDAIKVYALAEDSAFLRGVGSDHSPRGLRYRINSANIQAETLTTEGAPTLTEADTELERMMKLLKTNNALTDMSKPVWFMAANGEFYLRRLRDGNGNAVFTPEMNTGKLKGYPFFSTQQIPENLGGDGDESELYFVDADSCVIVDFLNMQAEFFPNGAHVVGGTQVTGIGNDASILRLMAEVDFNMRHDVAGAVTTEFSWGY